MFLKKDPLNLIITGVGGQGNVLASQLLGNALVAKDFFVTVGETYGASQRGGPVMSHLRISKKSQCSPLIPEGKADIVLALEPLEALRVMGNYGNPRVLMVVNSRPIYPLDVTVGNAKYPTPQTLRSLLTEFSHRVYMLAATDMALHLGAPILANIVMVAALVALEAVPLTQEDLAETIRQTFPALKLEINLKALQMGVEAIQIEAAKYKDKERMVRGHA
jgi:indolepyruvate ferredoxin oxidoreductase beta subunit